MAKLRPGGIAYFQVPTYGPKYRFNIEEYVAGTAAITNMEMHVLPQPALFDILRRNSCELLECREDSLINNCDGMISNSIFARKIG